MSLADVWVSAEFQRLAEIVNDYDPYLFLEAVPPSEIHKLNDKTKVFRIVDDRNKKIVMYADSLANPQEILTRLWSMDLKHGDVVGRLDAANRAVEVLRLKEHLERREAMMDFSAFIIKNTKSRWTHNGKIYDDEFRDLGPKKQHIDITPQRRVRK